MVLKRLFVYEIFFIALLFSCSSVIYPVSKEEVVQKSFHLGYGGSVSLTNVNGGITFSEWEKEEVEVYAHKKIRASSEKRAEEASKKLQILFTEGNNSLKIDTKYGKVDSFITGYDGSVEYKVNVPKGAKVNIESVNSKMVINLASCTVHAENVNGEVMISGKFVEAETVNGKLTITAGESIKGETVNGAIEANLTATPAKPCHLETVNGAINLKTSSKINANLKAENVNGSITCELSGNIKSTKHSLSGTIGNGGEEISLETVNGSIEITTSK